MSEEDIYRYRIRLMHYLVMNKDAFTSLPDEQWIETAAKVSLVAAMLIDNETLVLLDEDDTIIARSPMPS